MIGCLGLAILSIALFRIGYPREPWSSDEIDNASLAVAMVDSLEAWIRPNYHPFDPHTFDQMRKDVIAPPLANALMATPGLLGLRQPWTWPIVPFLLLFTGMSMFLRKIVDLPLITAMGLIGIVLLLSPRLLLECMTLKPEVSLSGFGLIGLSLALNQSDKKITFYAFLSGVCIGLGFLSKLWLIGPLALATSLAWLGRSSSKSKLYFGFFLLAFISTSLSHLILIYFIDPGSLNIWTTSIYFSVFNDEGIASTKWKGLYNYPNWSHPFWYYFLAIPRDLGLSFPFAIYGMWKISKETQHKIQKRSLVGAGIGLLIGLIVLSIPHIKEPLYVLSISTFCLTIAAFGVKELMFKNIWILSTIMIASLIASLVIIQPKKTNTQDDRLLFLKDSPLHFQKN